MESAEKSHESGISSDQNPPEITKDSRKSIIFGSIAGLIFLGLIITGVILLVNAKPETAGQVRDIFIILMSLEFLVIGLALVILIVQIAALSTLLRNEIKPILDSTNTTVKTLRGTATFLSDNLTEPVIRLNEYLAAFKKFFEVVRLTRR